MEVPYQDDHGVFEWKHWMSNMTVSDFLSTIEAELSPSAKVLSDYSTEEFK